MTIRRIVRGATLTAPPVALAKAQKESPWNVLAYATALRGRGANVALTSADFASCVANFERYGKEIPVVLYHADTKDEAHPDSRKAHAWITAMRVGAMDRDGTSVATLEGKFRWVNDATKVDVETGAIQFGSITIVQNGTDEETGESVGSYLWSFSLTNNPALVDLPRLAASRTIEAGYWYGEIDDRADVLAMLRVVFGLPALCPEADVEASLSRLEALTAEGADAEGIHTHDILAQLRDAMRLPALSDTAAILAAIRTALALPAEPLGADGTPPPADGLPMSRGPRAERSTMQNAMMAHAARLGIAALSEEDATRQVTARAEETLPLRKQLGLAIDAPASAVTDAVTALHKGSARVAVLEAEVEVARAKETERQSREVEEHLAALCTDPTLAKARTALESFARADFAAFSKAYPKPVLTAASSALTSRTLGDKSGTPAAITSLPRKHNDQALAAAREAMAADKTLTLEAALKAASRELATQRKAG